MGRFFRPEFPLVAVVSGTLGVIAELGAVALIALTHPQLPGAYVAGAIGAGVFAGLAWGGTSGAFDRPMGELGDSSLLAINVLPVGLALAIVWAAFSREDSSLRTLALIGTASAGVVNCTVLSAWRAHYQRLNIGW